MDEITEQEMQILIDIYGYNAVHDMLQCTHPIIQTHWNKEKYINYLHDILTEQRS